MSLGLKRLVLAAALLVMPLQGVAAAFAVLFCHSDLQKHAMHANGDLDRGMHQSGDPDEGSANGNSGYHPCHNTVSAPLFVALLAAAPDTPVRTFAPDPLHDLFVPERPQRPPLA